MTRHPCDRCGSSSTRRYLPGWRCAPHTPAALAGRPEPGATATAYRPQFGSDPLHVRELARISAYRGSAR
jgi:hypothetical protein